MKPTKILLTLLSTVAFTSLLSAEKAPAVTSINGVISFPEEMPKGVNTTGLSLTNAVVTLAGKYHHPRMPYPKSWKEMTPENRQAWRNKFTNSDDYPAYQERVKAAKANRFSTKTKLAEDGTFTFENIKPAWYQLTIEISSPQADGQAPSASAAASGLRQFFVRTTDKPLELGNITLRVETFMPIGALAPDFKIAGYDGKSFKLSDFRGKYVLFDFWATWCGPCIAQIPNLEAISEAYRKDRLVTLGLSMDSELDKAKAFLKKKPSHYRQGYVGEPENHKKISTAYGITSIPSIWLIDPEGKIVAKSLMGQGIAAAVKEALGEP